VTKRAAVILAVCVLAPLAISRDRPGARAAPPGVEVLRDLVYGTGGGRDLRLDLYLPEEAPRPMPLIVWVHGGGWRGGSKGRTRAAGMTARGYAVASVEYRLSGEAVFPAQIHDVKAAVRWLRANAEEYGLDPRKFGAWGSSAGGHLVALLGTSGGVGALEGEGGSADRSSRVQAVCDFFGPADLTRLGGGARDPVARLLGGTRDEKPDLARLASPVTHVSEDDPPFLLVHGDRDPLVPVAQSRLLHQMLVRAKVPSRLHEVEGAGHGWRRNPTVDRLVEDFFDEHLKGVKPAARIEGAFESRTTGRTERYLAWLPPGYEASGERHYPVIYWLHGLGGRPAGATGFARRIRRWIRAGEMPPAIVVAADGHQNGWYVGDVERTIVEELIPHVDRTFRTLADRSGRAIEGFSMGGFGAARLGFRHPHLFGAVSIMSGAVGRRGRGGGEDLPSLAGRNAEKLRETRIRIAVGERDRLWRANVALHDRLEELGIPHELVVARDVGHRHEQLYAELAGMTPRFYREVFGD